LRKFLRLLTLTLTGGVLVYVIGQLLSKILIEPDQELGKAITQIRIVLAVHAPTIHTPIGRSERTSEQAVPALRACSAELFKGYERQHACAQSRGSRRRQHPW
jgi:hypothetical protein